MIRRVAALVLAAAALVVAAWLALDRIGAGEQRPRLERPVAGNEEPRRESGATESPRPTPVDAEAPLLRPERTERALPFASGIVVDERGRPILGAAVIARRARSRGMVLQARLLLDDELDAATVARSDASGRFEVAELPPTTFSLLFTAEGRAPAEWRDLSTDRAENQGHAVLLRPARALEGVVRESGGAPIDHAVVIWSASAAEREWAVVDHLPEQPLCAFASAETGAATTDDAGGRFRFDRLPAERGRLSALADGYDETTIDEEEFAAAGGALVLERAAVVFEAVAAEDGRPLDDATAVVVHPTGWPVTWLPESEEAAHDDDGFESRRATRARLCWRASGFEGATVTVVAPGRRSRTIAVELDPEGEPPRYVVPLALGRDDASLAGRIVGAPAATIELRLALPSDSTRPLARRSPMAIASTDAARDFELRGLPPCHVRLDAFAEGCAPLRRELTLPAAGVVLEFAPAAAIDAVVRDRRRRPVAGVVVRVQTETGARAWQARTDRDGRCRFEGLPPGEWFVGAFPLETEGTGDGVLGGRAGDCPPSPPSWFRSDESIRLAAGERRELAVRLPEPALCHVHVVDERGAAVSGAPVHFTVVGRDGWIGRVRDGDEPAWNSFAVAGLVEASLVPTRWVVDVGTPPRAVREFFEVEPIDCNHVKVVLPSDVPLVQVEGRVVEFGSGRPLPGVTVNAQSDPRARLRARVPNWEISDADGRFVLEELLAGTVELVADGPRTFDPATRRSTSDWYSSRLALDLAADMPAVVELPLLRRDPPPADAIAVRLRLRDGKSGAWLTEGSVALHGQVGAVTIVFGSFPCDANGVVSAKLPRVGRCFATATYHGFVGTSNFPRLENVDLPIVDGAIDAVLEFQPEERR